MTERERLIELIGSKVCEDYSPNCDEWQPHSCEKCYANDCRIGELADYLLSNGVIVNPCKVGDTLQNVVRCKDCKYLMFSECYGECSKAIRGIVMPDDFCGLGERGDTNER